MNNQNQQHQMQAQGQQQGQSQNQIANPQSGGLPQVKGPQMNDRDRINDVLATEKQMILTNSIAAWEASHDQLHQDILQIVQETHACHRDIYNTMFQLGWYRLEAAEQQQLNQTYQTFSNYSTQFPYGQQTH